MFRFWLEFPPAYVLLWLLAIFAASGLLIHWLCCRSRFSGRIRQCTLATPFISSIAVLFALFLGFLLANAISQKNRAFQAVQTESTALLVLNGQREAMLAQTGAIREAIFDYAQAVVSDEWPQLQEGRSSPKAEAALFALIRLLAGRDTLDAVGSSNHGKMLALAEKVADARSDRIAIVTSHPERLVWPALFLLGVLTQLAISMVHLDCVRTNAVALSLFSLSAVIALWLIAIQENPFRGRVGVPPEPIARVIAAVR